MQTHTHTDRKGIHTGTGAAGADTRAAGADTRAAGADTRAAPADAPAGDSGSKRIIDSTGAVCYNAEHNQEILINH